MRIGTESGLTTLSIRPITIPGATNELLEHLENVDKIQEIYKLRKPAAKSSGISKSEAHKIKNCFRQGRELYIAGKLGSLMVKPLNFFYSLTAYSYAITILNNPARYALHTLPSSHGVQYIRSESCIKFAGEMTKGTFNELLFSFPTILVKNYSLEFSQSNLNTLKNYYKNTVKVSIGILLSMIPEIREFYNLLSGNKGRTYPLQIKANPSPRVQKWEFRIGDGTHLPPLESVEKVFPDHEIQNKYGQYVLNLESADLSKIDACIWTDEVGELWFIDNPFHPLNLPEICIHFLLINSLSTIMRYDPQSWGEIVLNEVNSNISLILRKYLSALEYKMPFMILRNSSGFWPYLQQ